MFHHSITKKNVTVRIVPTAVEIEHDFIYMIYVGHHNAV